jgi:hypothetical protein
MQERRKESKATKKKVEERCRCCNLYSGVSPESDRAAITLQVVLAHIFCMNFEATSAAL